MPTGRPTSYKKEYAAQGERLARLGLIDKEIALFFEVNEATLHRWKQRYPEFRESLKEGKVESDMRVVESLYHRAIGYEHTDTYFSNYQGKVTATEYDKHYAPDPTSMIFWLKNRRPDLWRDKQEHEHSGPKGEPIQTITRVIVDPKEK